MNVINSARVGLANATWCTLRTKSELVIYCSLQKTTNCHFYFLYWAYYCTSINSFAVFLELWAMYMGGQWNSWWTEISNIIYQMHFAWTWEIRWTSNNFCNDIKWPNETYFCKTISCKRYRFPPKMVNHSKRALGCRRKMHGAKIHNRSVLR